MRHAGAVAVILLPALSGELPADYVEVQRHAAVREAPDTSATVIAWVEEGDQLPLVSDDTPYYYCVSLPDTQRDGYIARSMVRRYAGDIPPPSPEPAPQPLPATTADPHRHLRLGKPQAVYEYLHPDYAGAVDARLKIPLWVQYELTSAQIEGPADREGRDFDADPALPSRAQATGEDYAMPVTGLAKGHIAPADDFSYSQTRLDETFYYSNACPQLQNGFNASTWKSLENSVRDWVALRGRLTVIAGPIFRVALLDNANPSSGAIKGTVTYDVMGNSLVAVPTAYYKIVVDDRDADHPEVLAFMMPHTSLTGTPPADYLCSVRDVERATGLDFLSALDDGVEAVVEAETADAPWPRP